MPREGRIPAIEIQDAKIIMNAGWRGFGPAGDRFGRRGFNLIIEDPEVAQDLIEWGWDVHIMPPREECDAPGYRLPVKVRYDKYPPKVIMITKRGGETELNDETVGILDEFDSFAKINVRITPSRYDNEALGRGTGVAAYLDQMKVWVEESRTMADDEAPWD